MRSALVILDGWGLADHDHQNPVQAASTPVFDKAREVGADGQLTVHGRRVGLPAGQMSNSEVGHLNIGAGRVVNQMYTRVNDAIEQGAMVRNDALITAIKHARDHDGRVHLMGLVSDGGVHSDLRHLEALIELCGSEDVPAVSHAFTDGRDTAPAVAETYVDEIAVRAEETGTGEIATVIGRYYAMDRDENWERTTRAYDAIVNREALHSCVDAHAAVQQARDRDESDEFIEPTLIQNRPALQSGDAVICFNFRADRVRQLVRMLTDTTPVWNFDVDPPDIQMTTLTRYAPEFDFPVAFPPTIPTETLGEAVTEAGLSQLRLAESEKYPHVTYFLNGGRETKFDGEIRRIVPSPDVATYDRQPEMSAAAITDEAMEVIDSLDPAVGVVNYANPDMVGHTGDFEATVQAIESVDEQLGRLMTAIQESGGHVLVTADHGNAENVGTPENPHTAHTYNPVPFVSVTPEGGDGGDTVRSDGSLCDVAPTMMKLADIDIPNAMTGESLLI
ncbi:MAG: phosphoglycerate mutase [uncultured archaeon A07HR60]|nr:MAG: phosphoglycerate mutase [uncultured archaeon A07HR60]